VTKSKQEVSKETKILAISGRSMYIFKTFTNT